MWTEYYGGAIRRCEELAHSRVVFGFPVADDGAISPDTHDNRYNDGTCENSNIEMVDPPQTVSGASATRSGSPAA